MHVGNMDICMILNIKNIVLDSALKKTFKIRQNALIVAIQDIGNSIFYERAKDCY